MGPDWDGVTVRLAATLPEIANEFFARFQLHPCRLVAVKITDQANSQRYVVKKIAVHMPAVNLASPAVAHFDLAVTSGSTVADDKMVSQTVLHTPNMTMVVIEHTRVSLPRPAVVHDNELPAIASNGGAPNLVDD
jgi:hypothetical protein